MPCEIPRVSAAPPSLAELLDLQSLAIAVLAQALDDIANGSWVEAHSAHAWLMSDDAVSHWMPLAGFGIDVSRWRCLPLAGLRRLRGSPLFAGINGVECSTDCSKRSRIEANSDQRRPVSSVIRTRYC